MACEQGVYFLCCLIFISFLAQISGGFPDLKDMVCIEVNELLSGRKALMGGRGTSDGLLRRFVRTYHFVIEQ